MSMRARKWSGPLLWGISAGLLALAQPPFALSWLAWVALVPWICALHHKTVTEGAGSGLLLGFLYGLILSRWIPEALAAQGITTVSTLAGWAVTSLYATGLPYALLGGLIGWTQRRFGGLQIPFVAAFVFALDALRSAWFWGIPWGLLGHSQANVPGIAQLAAVGGVPLISALVVGANLAFARVWMEEDRMDGETERGRSRKLAAVLAGAGLALGLGGVRVAEIARGPGPEDTEPRRLLALSYPAFARERWVPAIQRTQLRMLGVSTRAALAREGRGVDLVLWPENALTQPLVPGEPLYTDLIDLRRALGTPIVLGTVEGARASGSVRSFATWVGADGITDRVEKAVGVPVVETAGDSALQRGLRRLFGIDPAKGSLRAEDAAGSLRGDFSVAPLLCYEAIYPKSVRARREPDTRAIVHLSSDSWMRDPSVVAAQLEAYSRFRAIEQRLPYVRVSDAGGATVIDAYGREVARVPVRQAGAVVAEVRASAPVGRREKVALILLALLGGGLGFLCIVPLQRSTPWPFDLSPLPLSWRSPRSPTPPRPRT